MPHVRPSLPGFGDGMLPGRFGVGLGPLGALATHSAFTAQSRACTRAQGHPYHGQICSRKDSIALPYP